MPQKTDLKLSDRVEPGNLAHQHLSSSYMLLAVVSSLRCFDKPLLCASHTLALMVVDGLEYYIDPSYLDMRPSAK